MIPFTALFVRFVYLLWIPCGKLQYSASDERQVRRWKRWNNAAFAVFWGVMSVLVRLFGR